MTTNRRFGTTYRVSSSMVKFSKKVVPKRQLLTVSRRSVTQKTEEFSSTAAEACDLASGLCSGCVGSVTNQAVCLPEIIPRCCQSHQPNVEINTYSLTQPNSMPTSRYTRIWYSRVQIRINDKTLSGSTH